MPAIPGMWDVGNPDYSNDGDYTELGAAWADVAEGSWPPQHTYGLIRVAPQNFGAADYFVMLQNGEVGFVNSWGNATSPYPEIQIGVQLYAASGQTTNTYHPTDNPVVYYRFISGTFGQPYLGNHPNFPGTTFKDIWSPDPRVFQLADYDRVLLYQRTCLSASVELFEDPTNPGSYGRLPAAIGDGYRDLEDMTTTGSSRLTGAIRGMDRWQFFPDGNRLWDFELEVEGSTNLRATLYYAYPDEADQPAWVSDPTGGFMPDTTGTSVAVGQAFSLGVNYQSWTTPTDGVLNYDTNWLGADPAIGSTYGPQPPYLGVKTSAGVLSSGVDAYGVPFAVHLTDLDTGDYKWYSFGPYVPPVLPIDAYQITARPSVSIRAKLDTRIDGGAP